MFCQFTKIQINAQNNYRNLLLGVDNQADMTWLYKIKKTDLLLVDVIILYNFTDDIQPRCVFYSN